MSPPKNALTELPLPKLFVFDLDYTLWPFWCDTHVSPPFKVNESNIVVDQYGYKIELYDDVREILTTLRSNGVLVAAASRTHAPKVAEDLLKLLDINMFFNFKELYSGKKLAHFAQFKKNSNLEYNEMIFFDDEMRNINDLSAVGVVSHFVKDGLTINDLVCGIQSFRKRSK